VATTSKRGVQLDVSIETIGAESISQVRDELLGLGKAGKTAAPEIDALSKAIDRIEDSSQAIAVIDSLGDELFKVVSESDAAAKSVAELGASLALAREKSLQLSQAQKSASLALNEAKAAVQAKSDEIRQLRVFTDDQAKSTSEYSERLKQLKIDHILATNEQRKLSDAYSQSKQALIQANQEQTNLAKKYKEASAASDAAAKSQAELSGEIDKAIGVLKGAGLAAEDLAASQQKIQQSFQKTKQEIASALDLKAAEQKAKESADKIEAAFGQIGQRSAASIRQELQSVRAAMELLGKTSGLAGSELSAAMSSAEQRVKSLERELREATGQVTLMDRVSSGLSTTLGKFGIFLTLAESVRQFGLAFFESNKQIEAMRLGLTTIFGSSKIAADQIDFLRKQSNAAGIAIGDISGNFVKFSASMNAANIPLAQSNELFKNVTQASGALGLSGDKVNRILEALSQIASKGVVSMEELRGQLGDALPGALSLTAKGLGITEAELIKLVESGQLASREFIGPFTEALKSYGAEVTTLGGAWQNLKNGITQGLQALGDTGVTEALRKTFIGLTVALNAAFTAVSSLSEAFFSFGRAAGAAWAAINLGQNPIRALNAEFEASSEKIRLLNKEFVESSNRLLGLGDSAGKASQGVSSASSVAANSSSAWVQLNVGINTATDGLKAAVDTSKKYVEAAQAESKSRNDLATLSGNQITVAQAAVQASQVELKAYQAEYQARLQLLDASKAYLETKKILIGLETDPKAREEKQKDIDALKQKIDLQTQEVDKARASSEAAAVAASKQVVLRDALNDTSGALASLRANYELNENRLNLMAAAEQNSAQKSDELKAQAIRTSQALGLYSNAIADVTDKIRGKIQIQQADSALVEAQLNLEKAKAVTQEKNARLIGDEAGVLQALIAQKQIDIRIATQRIEISKLEAEAKIAELNNLRQELDLSGKLTPSKLAEIDANLKLAQAKIILANGSKETIKQMEIEIETLRRTGIQKDNVTQKSNDYSRALSQEAGSYSIASAEGEKYSEVLDRINAKYGQSVKDREFKTASVGSGVGSVLTKDALTPVDNTGLSSLQAKQRAGTLSGDDLKTAQAVYDAANANREVFEKNATVFSLDGARSIFENVNAATTLLDQVKRLSRNSRAVGGPPQQSQTSPQQSVVVKIDLGNGRTRDVNVASSNDANSLIAALKDARLAA
jgi:tape measure domain-containing protein